MPITAQSGTESEILNLSLEKFRWKTTGEFDSLADLFDDELVFVHITGHITTKDDWINQLKTERFVYNKIEQKEASVISQKSLATLITKIIESPEKYVRENLGVNKPNS